jgi:Xaa-Pro aminopeptidase
MTISGAEHDPARQERVRSALAEAGVDSAVLSSIPSVAQAAGYWPRWEMWPGQSPHTLDPTLCCAWPDREPVLLLPNYYGPYASDATAPVAPVPSYSYLEAVDQVGELVGVLARTLGPTVGRLGFEPRTLSAAVVGELAARVRVGEWVDVTPALERVRAVKTEGEIEGIRRAAAVADTIQRTVKDVAEPGRREIDVVGDALAAAWSSLGRRAPILIQLKAGASSAVRGEWHPAATVLREGDVVCTDTAPWLDGLWADSCNGIAVGARTERHEEVFAVANAALRACIAAARPGVAASAVDAAAREVVRAAGHDYPHHTGHGIGYVRAEAPRITPTSTDVLEAGNVIALEPGVYIEGWGGFRNEHVVVVRPEGAEVLTRFEHTL